MWACERVCVYTCVHVVCVCLCVCVCACVCVFIHMYSHTIIQAYIHTYGLSCMVYGWDFRSYMYIHMYKNNTQTQKHIQSPPLTYHNTHIHTHTHTHIDIDTSIRKGWATSIVQNEPMFSRFICGKWPAIYCYPLVSYCVVTESSGTKQHSFTEIHTHTQWACSSYANLLWACMKKLLVIVCNTFVKCRNKSCWK